MSDTATVIDGTPIKRSVWGRLTNGQTAIDFIGGRKYGFVVSTTLIIVTVISLFAQGLNLGIDFKGGVSWDVPAAEFSVGDAEAVLADNGLSTEGARIQERSSDSGEFIKVQVGDQTAEVGQELAGDFAAAANVSVEEITVNLVSSSWGAAITNKAIRALVIFLIAVGIFISIRFEWRMAMAALIAVAHDVIISVGIYSILQLVVTPATVIAFLTILGYSLYDTIVVFDRVRENEARFAALRPPYDDIINVSMNQVLMRSMITSFSSVVPVLSLLLIGSGLLGASTLSEFALALLIGMITGAYSSIFVAAPLLGVFKSADPSWKGRQIPRAVGDALRAMVMGGQIGSRRSREEAAADDDAVEPVGPSGDTDSRVTQTPDKPTPRTAAKALQHPPRPRKKKRR